MKHARMLLIVLATLLAGCVQRTITIESEPTGALVYLNDVEVGRTPVTVPFTFYGVYDVRLSKEGYATLNTSEKAVAPWWEAPGPDLIAEAVPNNKVALRWSYHLDEQVPVDPVGLVDRAQQLRARLESDDTTPLAPLPEARQPE